MSQPFAVAQVFTGFEGKLVPLKDTIRSFKEILSGAHDSLPESAFYMVGTIEDVMLDKMSNNIMFAVIGFGGFLGIGEKFHAIPWSSLDYRSDEGGYVVPFTRDQLEDAPVYSIDALTGDDGRNARDESHAFFGIAPYW